MEPTNNFKFGEIWREIIKYSDMSDLFNLELVNRELKEKINNFYFQRNNDNKVAIEDKYKKSKRENKKKFYEYHMNSFITFGVGDIEFSNEDENREKSKYEEAYDPNHSKKKLEKVEKVDKGDKVDKVDKGDKGEGNKISPKLIEARFTAEKEDNRIFSKNIQDTIIINSNKLLVLYTTGDIIIFLITKEQNFVYKMKFKAFDNPIKQLIYLDDRDYFLCLDLNGNIFYFNNPDTALNNNVNQDDILKVNQINIDIKIKNLFYIKHYILFFDQDDKLYYLKFADLVPEFEVIPREKKLVDQENVYGLSENKTESESNVDDTKTSDIKDNKGLDEKKSKINVYSLHKYYATPVKFATSELFFMMSDSNQNLFSICSVDLEKGFTEIKLISEIKATNIINIALSDKFWLVLDRAEKQPIEQWNFEEVGDWFAKLKLDDYLNIIKYEKINGKDIINADETFFLNVIGMQNDEIKKIKYERELVKNTTCTQAKLWVWGVNKNGQLGISSSIFYKNPVVVNLPELKNQTDYIDRIFCGKSMSKFSLLLSKFGEIFITGNYDLKGKLQVIENTNLEIKNKKEKEKKNNKNEIKKENKSSVSDKSKNKHVIVLWQSLTNDLCYHDINDTESFFKVKNILILSNQVFCFGYKNSAIPFTMLNGKPKLKHAKKGDKFPTADLIIEKIIKNYKNKISDIDRYFIVYEDRFLHILESNIEEFEKSETQYHRIIQIKYFKEVIWDRKKRFYKFIE